MMMALCLSPLVWFLFFPKEIWAWHRESNQVNATTASNNIRVFLLFAGFISKVWACVCYLKLLYAR